MHLSDFERAFSSFCRRLLIIAAIALVVPASRSGAEENDSAGLNELRAAYKHAQLNAADAPLPKRGDANIKERRDAWFKAAKKLEKARHELATALLTAWKSSDASNDRAELEKEIQSLHQDVVKPPVTGARHKELQFYAGVIWKFVNDHEISNERGAFLASLTVPHEGIRRNDKLARLGFPTEPWGWDIQMTHSLALLRAGKMDEARNENEALLTKVKANISSGRLPDVKVNFRGGKRSNQSLKGECLLHRALIETAAGELDAARAFLREATQTNESPAILEEQKGLRQEIDAMLGK